MISSSLSDKLPRSSRATIRFNRWPVSPGIRRSVIAESPPSSAATSHSQVQTLRMFLFLAVRFTHPSLSNFVAVLILGHPFLRGHQLLFFFPPCRRWRVRDRPTPLSCTSLPTFSAWDPGETLESFPSMSLTAPLPGSVRPQEENF